MGDRLGPTQRKVLLALAEVGDEAPTAREVAGRITYHVQSGRTPREIAARIAYRMSYQSRRPTAETENVANCLSRMVKRGWVERLGKAADGARCWAITDAGRHALEAADHE